MSSFSGFKDGINFLRRRFSSNDLPNEPDPSENAIESEVTSDAPSDHTATSPTTSSTSSTVTGVTEGLPASTADPSLPNTSTSVKASVISAPCTPSKGGDQNGKGDSASSGGSSSKTSEGLSFAKSLFGRGSSKASSLTSHSFEAAKNKILLVVDEKDVPWSSYFIGKKVAGFDLKVEQLDFSSFCVTSSAVDGAVVHVKTRTVSKGQFSRSFKPDFTLVRQKVVFQEADHRPVLLALMHGGAPCFQDPFTSLIFADVALLTCRLNNVAKKHNFPFIPGDFFCRLQDIHRKVQNGSMEYPIVLKVGNHQNASGMIKVNNLDDLENVLNLIASEQSYCFIQEHVTTEYEVIAYKIGSEYRAFSRTSLDGKWNVSASKVIIEEIKVAERYKEWLEALSESLGGLLMCGVQVLVTKCGKEFIIGAYDSSLTLLGDKQDEDHRSLSQVVLKVFERKLKEGRMLKIQKIKEDPESAASISVGNEGDGGNDVEGAPQTEKSLKMPTLKSLSGGKTKDNKSVEENASGKEEDGEDTMKNLRKTFAGIFGDM